MTQLILAFSSPDTSLALTGGKGSNLAALARAGLNVPLGFIVTTDAYRAFVESHELQPRILALAKSITPDDPIALDRASAEIRALFEQCEMPDTIPDAVLSAYRHLLAEQTEQMDQSPVAVRSSATAEDLPGLAFAGQQETYLNVTGENALLDAVKKCWGSLWTPRAMAYRARNGIPPDEIALAVVVQRMIASESSGVLFTANPLTGRRDEIVVDASFGLGEAIVSGQVEPDHYVVDPHNWQVKECRLGAKAIAIVPAAGGGTRQIAQDAARQQALPDAEIIKLAKMAEGVQELFGAPQDIEWAYAGGELYLLQSRPITSLYPVPANPFPDPGLRVYFSLNSIQGVSEPFTPLGANTLQMLVLSGFIHLFKLSGSASDYFTLAGERIYIDITDLARDPRLRHVVIGMFERGDPGALAPFRELLADGRIPVHSALTPRFALHLLPRVLPLLRTALGALLNPEHARTRAVTQLQEMIGEETEQVRAAQDLSSLLSLMQVRLPGIFERVIRSVLPIIFPAIAGLTIIGNWLKDWLGERPGLALELMRGVPYNVTTEMDLRLWAIAQDIRTDPASVAALHDQSLDVVAERYRRGELPQRTQEGIARFLNEYGMRAVSEIDIGRPRWSDDPTPIISTLLGYLDLTDPNLAPDAVFARGQQQAEQLTLELTERVRRTRSGWFRARILAAAIKRMRVLGGLRELPKFKMIQVIGLYRTALIERARKLVLHGELEQAEDIFFVPYDTLKRFAAGEPTDLKALVAANRVTYSREQTRRRFPRLLLSTGEAFYEGMRDKTIGSNDLIGDPVSPGVAEGQVHVVLDPRGVRLEPGEILVCPATDPGWTPLFLTAGGLVMEIGGLVTHGSVVAREYGIPAVVGVHDATKRLHTGQRVRVDGNTGRVFPIE